MTAAAEIQTSSLVRQNMPQYTVQVTWGMLGSNVGEQQRCRGSPGLHLLRLLQPASNIPED